MASRSPESYPTLRLRREGAADAASSRRAARCRARDRQRSRACHMLRAHMKHFTLVILVSVGALAASAAVALAHSTPFAWTASKARVTLQDESTIALPQDQREALDAELEALLDEVQACSCSQRSRTQDQWRARRTYDNYLKRFKKAQDDGERRPVDRLPEVRRPGQGAQGKRYKHFRCDTNSYVLEIPNIELKPGADPPCPKWSRCRYGASGRSPPSSPST